MENGPSSPPLQVDQIPPRTEPLKLHNSREIVKQGLYQLRKVDTVQDLSRAGIDPAMPADQPSGSSMYKDADDVGEVASSSSLGSATEFKDLDDDVSKDEFMDCENF
ncbi:uncharacterized protein [Drosophila pseudoobscura]|uniref:Uncharacterized protein n=1 Tax=Drosophila pseudoobscura pseudoobscura TaxID=46245 RepID=A0A6I8W7K1_DROPS|nr:uncharacterized protein LOC6901772 [Drosophila pseudoobscura]